ncbi:MAG: hypothetical protein K9K67_09225 [Bacteriovoracaceae bacterium]|nr:hypothetical protein [Bacteriovoracaceae bacterium]
MDFKKVLEKSKFLFHWDNHDSPYSLDVQDFDRDSLTFANDLALPLGDSPRVTVSIKVRHYWHEHYFEQTEWLVGANGRVSGLKLLGPSETLTEWKKNLEMGLCV